MSVLTAPPLRVVDREVLRSGEARYVDLDVAATAPPLLEVEAVVADVLAHYGSVHRGSGWRSQVATAVLEEARAGVARFAGARTDDVVVFTRGTTDALNLLASCLPDDVTTLVFASEHHANLLPWRRRRHVVLPIPRSPQEAVERLAAVVTRVRRPPLLAVTGASNVTGDRWPVAELAAVVHDHDGRVVVDAAQLAPHSAIDMQTLGADWIAFSGHKLYAPYGTGALVGTRDWLDTAPPFLTGGGAAAWVTASDAAWVPAPARHEAGTPNLVGTAALATGCRVLAQQRDRLEAHEARLQHRLREGLAGQKHVRVLGHWPGPVVGIVSFVVEGWTAEQVADHLAGLGIGVRSGKFCAHPFVDHLTGGNPAVRASLGGATTEEDVDALLDAIAHLPRAGRSSVIASRTEARATARRILRIDRRCSSPNLGRDVRQAHR